MAQIPRAPAPKPYVVTVRVSGADSPVHVWAFGPEEAVYQALMATASALGVEELSVVRVEPDIAAWIKSHVNVEM